MTMALNSVESAMGGYYTHPRIKPLTIEGSSQILRSFTTHIG